ncbi:unnamed protein product [Mytilus edulis]|uniref:Uncharacterized protein n=1 Tax=Mytilus edulis TaxID=6550 RepID=A0A8S3Q3W4_MYTED|nr:unnamed protein product [Mytilus edulis]
MSSEKHESLEFYKYLCQKIGSEEVVKMRRLALCISDMCQNGDDRITSGSKGEGLCMKGSDFDIMGIDSTFKVYESETDVIFEGPTIPLIMNTEETGPCFTQLSLLGHHKAHKVGFENIWETNDLGCMLSSEQYKQTGLSKGLFALHLSKLCRCVADVSEYQNSSDNKYKYDDYKRYLSYLLIGVHSDAMTGWLKLASFLYSHKHYLASLSVIHYALQNYTDEKIFTGFATSADFPFVQNQ